MSSSLCSLCSTDLRRLCRDSAPHTWIGECLSPWGQVETNHHVRFPTQNTPASRQWGMERVRFVSWSHPGIHETQRCRISLRGKCKSVDPHLLYSVGIDRQTTTPTPDRERGKQEFGASECQTPEQEPTTPHALLATIRGGTSTTTG